MITRRRLYPVTCLLVAMVLLLGACATSPSQAPATSKPPAASVAPAPLTAQPAAKVIELKYATDFAPSVTNSEFDQMFFAELEKRTAGKVKVKFYWAGSLATEKEIPEFLKTGGADMGLVSVGKFPDRFPYADAWLGYLKNLTLGLWKYKEIRLLNANLFLTLPAQQQELAKQNLKTIRYGSSMEYDLLSKKPIKRFADFKGMKVRAVGDSYIPVWEAAGAVAASLGLSEVYEGLSRGTLDGSLADFNTFAGLKWYETAKNVILFGWPIQMTTCYMNLNTWNGLPDDVKQTISKLTEEAQEWSDQWFLGKYDADKKNLQDKGCTFTEWPGADIIEWKAKFPDFTKRAMDIAKAKNLDAADITKTLDGINVILAKYEKQLKEGK